MQVKPRLMRIFGGQFKRVVRIVDSQFKPRQMRIFGTQFKRAVNICWESVYAGGEEIWVSV